MVKFRGSSVSKLMNFKVQKSTMMFDIPHNKKWHTIMGLGTVSKIPKAYNKMKQKLSGDLRKHQKTITKEK